MPSFSIEVESEIVRDAKVMQVEGMFDVAPAKRSKLEWKVDLPIEERPWNIGLIIGPSGCGKTTVAKTAFDKELVSGYDWDGKKAVVSQFGDMSIKDVCSALSSVGFSSAPSWLRPFHALSNGEQFRVTLARAISSGEMVCIDEFTSVVDRTVAKIGSCAVAKAVRKKNSQLVAVSCHYDIVEWLQPDWTYEPIGNKFEWRSLRRRPDIEMEVRRCTVAAWELFKAHHYLSTSINKSAACFVAEIEGRPAAFSSVISFMHPTAPGWKSHRVVCLPDFQGVGIGNALAEYVASMFLSTGKPFYATTANHSMIHYRARSKKWKMTRSERVAKTERKLGPTSYTRNTYGFRYVGPSNVEDALEFGIVPTGLSQGSAKPAARPKGAKRKRRASN